MMLDHGYVGEGYVPATAPGRRCGSGLIGAAKAGLGAQPTLGSIHDRIAILTKQLDELTSFAEGVATSVCGAEPEAAASRSDERTELAPGIVESLDAAVRAIPGRIERISRHLQRIRSAVG